MNLLKDAVVETIRRMPENATARDIMYEIYLIDNVLEGLKASEEGETITIEELLKRVEIWSKWEYNINRGVKNEFT